MHNVFVVHRQTSHPIVGKGDYCSFFFLWYCIGVDAKFNFITVEEKFSHRKSSKMSGAKNIAANTDEYLEQGEDKIPVDEKFLFRLVPWEMRLLNICLRIEYYWDDYVSLIGTSKNRKPKRKKYLVMRILVQMWMMMNLMIIWVRQDIECIFMWLS